MIKDQPPPPPSSKVKRDPGKRGTRRMPEVVGPTRSFRDVTLIEVSPHELIWVVRVNGSEYYKTQSQERAVGIAIKIALKHPQAILQIWLKERGEFVWVVGSVQEFAGMKPQAAGRALLRRLREPALSHKTMTRGAKKKRKKRKTSRELN